MLFLYFACGKSSEISDTSHIADTASNHTSQNTDVYAKTPNQLLATTGEEIYFAVDESKGFSFELYFGDGDIFIWNQDDHLENISHVYTEEGNFQAVLTAFSENGNKDSQSIAVHVRNPPQEHPVLYSAPMVQIQQNIFVVFEEGQHLIHVAEDKNISFWETCYNPQSIAVMYDSNQKSYIPQIGVVCDDGIFQTWSAEGNRIDQFDLGKGSHPTAIVGRDHHWYITTAGTSELVDIHTDDQGFVFEHTMIGQVSDPKGITMHANGAVLFIPRFRSIDGQGQILRFQKTNGFWEPLQNIILELDERGDSDNTTGGVPNLLQQMHISKDGEHFHIAMTHANILRGNFRNGIPLTHESTLRAVMSIGTFDENNNIIRESVSDRKQLDEKGRIHQIISDNFDQNLYILHEGTSSITILDAHSYQLRGSVWDLGFAPHAMVFIPHDDEKELLVVYSWLSRNIVALDVSVNPPAIIWNVDLKNADGWENVEVYDAEMLRGKQIFHDAKDSRITKSGYIACSHCHPNGDQDGLTWDFSDRGEGLRNTSSLLGRGGLDMGALHWSGNFDEVQDFEGDMRLHFGGSGFLSESDWQSTQESLGLPKAGLSEDLDALAVYISSLDQTPVSPFEIDANTIDNYQNIFTFYDCHNCHPAPLYTISTIENNSLFDIGSITENSGQRLGADLNGLDVPTLLGIVFTPPYLHDGSASSLEEAILAHTNTAPISNSDLQMLVDFLRNL